MREWFLGLARRCRRRPPPLAPPELPPGFDFDALARDLAAGLSRREALRRLGAGLAGAALASLGLEAAAQAQGNSDCAQWCDGVFGPGPERGNCASAAAQGGGLCFQCGPAAPAGHPEVCSVAGIGPTCCPSTAPHCCGGRCVDRATDSNNCGQCGRMCPLGQVCQGGQCVTLSSPNPAPGANPGLPCSGSLPVACGATCCPANTICNPDGSCGLPCPPPGTACGTTCVDLQTNLFNCGACGSYCAPRIGPTGQITLFQCSYGHCCPSGHTYCGGNCVNLSFWCEMQDRSGEPVASASQRLHS